jgi:hypothetical protein
MPLLVGGCSSCGQTHPIAMPKNERMARNIGHVLDKPLPRENEPMMTRFATSGHFLASKLPGYGERP